MHAKLIPITQPGIDLRAFVGIIGQQAVNEIDANQRLQPLGKFAEAVDELLPAGHAYFHIYQAFYYELPCNVATELSLYTHVTQLRITSVFEGLMVKGIMSAPLGLWRNFLLWCCNSDRTQFMRGFGNGMYAYFKQYPYFQDLQIRERPDNTFALVRIVNGRAID